MTTLTLRKSLKGNWGLFQKQETSGGGFYYYPKCACPDCTGRPHAKYEIVKNLTWVAIYVHLDKDNVLEWAKNCCITVIEESNINPSVLGTPRIETQGVLECGEFILILIIGLPRINPNSLQKNWRVVDGHDDGGSNGDPQLAKAKAERAAQYLAAPTSRFRVLPPVLNLEYQSKEPHRGGLIPYPNFN